MSHVRESEPAGRRSLAKRRWPRRLICMQLLAAIAGCGSSQSTDRLPVFPVVGKLVYDGRPLKGAFVILHPKSAAHGKAAPRPHAQAAADGSFALTSYESSDGAPAGNYTVTVELRSLVSQGGDVTAGPNTLPAKYSRAETSPLIVQIAEGRNDLSEIRINK
jgi:hypothetical protein